MNGLICAHSFGGLIPSRAHHEYYHDTPQLQAFMSDHIIPAPRYGLNVKLSQKERVLRPRPFSSYQPNPDNVSRYMDRILAAEDNQRDIMTRRLILRVYWMNHRDVWPAFVELFRDRLGVDLPKSARTFPYQHGRKVYPTIQSRLGIALAL